MVSKEELGRYFHSDSAVLQNVYQLEVAFLKYNIFEVGN
jgi:hypothetical protein